MSTGRVFPNSMGIYAETIEATGKTVEEAVTKALEELKAEKEDVDIEVLDEGNKGLLGIISGKTVKVRVSRKSGKTRTALDFVYDVLEKMGIDAELEYSEDDESIKIDIEGENCGIVIGRRGETLDAFQYLASLVANKNSEEYKRVILDVEDYRGKREDALVRLANKLAERVVTNKKNIILEPMNPYERRIIHSTLQGSSSVRTYSIGDDPNRKVVISLK